MRIALIASVFIHVVILSIKFEPEIRRIKDSLPTLEVVLVNAKTKSSAKNAEVLAQANLDRGGNTDAKRKMKSTLPALKRQSTEVTTKPTTQTKKTSQTVSQLDEEAKEQKRVAALEQEVRELMTQLNTSKKVASQPAQQVTAKESGTGSQTATANKLNLNDITAAAIEMDRLEAIIAKQQDEYQKRPKRKFIGARAKEYRYALYVDAWRQKIEKIGKLNYPEEARNLKLYGQLQMTVSIKSDGSVEAIELNRSSGYKVLDEAAKRIVELGEPYAKFPEDIRKETDILSITRTWTFTKEDSLATE